MVGSGQAMRPRPLQVDGFGEFCLGQAASGEAWGRSLWSDLNCLRPLLLTAQVWSYPKEEPMEEKEINAHFKAIYT